MNYSYREGGKKVWFRPRIVQSTAEERARIANQRRESVLKRAVALADEYESFVFVWDKIIRRWPVSAAEPGLQEQCEAAYRQAREQSGKEVVDKLPNVRLRRAIPKSMMELLYATIGRPMPPRR